VLKVSCGYDLPHHGDSLLVDNGPSLQINIGFDKDWKPDQNAPPRADKVGIIALVDTGSLESYIDVGLAAELKLPPCNVGDVIGIHGPQPATYYLAQVHFPPLKFTARGQFAALPLIKGGMAHHALIGRTFRHFRMGYNGVTGAVTIYRDESPSLKRSETLRNE
jgi:hypothetical protein